MSIETAHLETGISIFHTSKLQPPSKRTSPDGLLPVTAMQATSIGAPTLLPRRRSIPAKALHRGVQTSGGKATTWYSRVREARPCLLVDRWWPRNRRMAVGLSTPSRTGEL